MLLALLVFAVAYAQAGMPATDFIGTEDRGTEGGQFHTPRGIAANDSSTTDANDGAIYVADDNNQRIQRFDSEGNFERAWGKDVDGSNAGTGFEFCTIAADCKAGDSGSANGELDNPQGVAVDQTDGSVYVSDRDNRRVQKFDADGNFSLSFGSLGSAGGEFGSSFRGQLAVAPAGAPNAGNVIVADPANSRVQEFDSSGNFVRTFGFDVAASGADDTGTDFEVCTDAGSGAANCKAGTSGSGVGQFASSQPRGVAVDTAGAIYAVESSDNFRVQKFTPQVGPPELSPAVFADSVLTGSGSSSAPSEVAVDSTSDDVYVVKTFAEGTGTPPAESTERRILELDSSGGLNDTHLANSGFNSANGLGINASAGTLYLSTSNSTFGRRVYILSDVPPPVATVTPATDVSATGATLNGTVEPNGAFVDYRFQYSDDGGASWTSLPVEDAGNSTDPVAVERDLDGRLKPSTEYQVRLQVAQRYGDESDTSGVETFTTAPSAPTLAPFATADAESRSATLHSRVNPNSEATTYWFEWGTTDSYGNTTSAKSAGSGSESVFASAGMSGLGPDTTYHFRLVAENATGRTEGADHSFKTRAAEPASCPNADFRQGKGAHLPDCRAYEQVSPVEKNGGDIVYVRGFDVPGGNSVAVGGEAAIFESWSAFAGQDWGGGGGAEHPYLGRRTPAGWETTPMIPRPDDPGSGGRAGLSAESLDATILDSTTLLTADPLAGNRRFYFRDNQVGSLAPIVGFDHVFRGSMIASPDVEHVVFASRDVLTSDPVPASTEKVYEATEGSIRLVSVRPDGSPFDANAEPAGKSPLASHPSSGTGGVSDDGRHIFFTTPRGVLPDTAIYRRTDGSTTALASPSHRTPVDPQAPKTKRFRAATPDGNRVFFTSAEHLTDYANTGPTRAGLDLYRYDFAAEELVDISATQGGDGALVEGVVGISDDGDRAFYVASGQVNGDGVDGEPNLFLWEDDGSHFGVNRFVATLDPGDAAATWGVWRNQRLARVTRSGSHLVFQSTASIPGHQNGGVSQIYRYDADANGGAGSLACVSCNPDGETPLGPSTLTPHAVSDQVWEFPRSISSDGRRVFFDSADDLLPRDTNGEIDAYMWEDGELSLLSTGKGSAGARFFNASADGDDAFFLTRESLVPQDTDNLMDLYDARVGGGFPAPELPADCTGDDCQGEPGSAPEPEDAASAELQGSSNVTPSRPARVRVLRLNRAQKLRLSYGRPVAVRVLTSRRGPVLVTLRARVGRRAPLVARGARRARRAGMVRVPVRLSRPAQHWLARGRPLRIVVRANARGARPAGVGLRLREVRR